MAPSAELPSGLHPDYSASAEAIHGSLERCGVTHFVTMPDYVQVALNESMDASRSGIQVVNCATEDEAIAIAFGLHIGGMRPYLSMQNQGIFACANALRSVGVNSRTPLPILVGQWGRELANLGHDPGESTRLEVRLVEPLLDALRIPFLRLEDPEDLSCVEEAFEMSHDRSLPVAVLIGAHVYWG